MCRYGTFLCSISICMSDLFLSLMVFNVWGHFKILIHTLETFPRPAAERVTKEDGKVVVEGAMYSESELELIATKLKDAIIYHRLIAE